MHLDIIYVNKTHIYSILVIVQGIKPEFRVERNPPLTVVTFGEGLREWDSGFLIERDYISNVLFVSESK